MSLRQATGNYFCTIGNSWPHKLFLVTFIYAFITLFRLSHLCFILFILKRNQLLQGKTILIPRTVSFQTQIFPSCSMSLVLSRTLPWFHCSSHQRWWRSWRSPPGGHWCRSLQEGRVSLKRRSLWLHQGSSAPSPPAGWCRSRCRRLLPGCSRRSPPSHLLSGSAPSLSWKTWLRLCGRGREKV